MASAVQVATIVIDSLRNAGVKYVFGIPGAKIDAIFNCLLDHPEIKLIVCRHEQNAAFMAAIVGRLTGTPGVCVATSGPGAGNLTTGLVTATTEGDPVVALIGSVPRAMSIKHTHQSMNAIGILSPATKSACSIEVEDNAAEIVLQSFRTALASPRGATVIQIPADIAAGHSTILPFPRPAFRSPEYGSCSPALIEQVVEKVQAARCPVFLLGQRSGYPQVISAVRKFAQRHPIAIVETFQAAGAVSHELVPYFYGRVGLFRNQVGDRLIDQADLVLTIGYDPVEYDTALWNPSGLIKIVNIDDIPCAYEKNFRPEAELLGSISDNLTALSQSIKTIASPANSTICKSLHQELSKWEEVTQAQIHHIRDKTSPGLIHPLHFILEFQKHIGKDTVVICDIGTVYIYMMRYFRSYEPRHLLCSNGQQTLGVSLPWAIATSLIQEPPCSQKVVSISGDGGFMFSAQELSTAVLQKCNITHFIWNSGTYNMVEFQEDIKYGRSSGIDIGGVDFVQYAKAFGAKGFRVDGKNSLSAVMTEALAFEGVAIVEVMIDYSDSSSLAADLVKDSVG